MSDNEELKGAFFVDGNCQIMSKGTITVNGATRYCSLLKAQSQKGEEIYELAVSAGRVYYNPPEKKQNPKSPDVSGKVTIDGQGYKFGAWNNVAASGQNYLGISMSVNDGGSQHFGSSNQQSTNQQPQTNSFDKDDIPF